MSSDTWTNVYHLETLIQNLKIHTQQKAHFHRYFIVGFLFLFLNFLIVFNAYGESQLADQIRLEEFETYIDSSTKMAAHDVLQYSLLAPNNPEKFVTGYTSGNVWVSFVLENMTENEVGRIVSIDYPLIDQLDIFQVSPEGSIAPLAQTGISRGRSSRPIDSPYFAFSVQLQPKSKSRFLLRGHSNTSMTFPISINDPLEYQKRVNFADFVFGIYIGLILLMALYNLSLGFAARDINHIYYFFAILSFHGLGVLTLFGYPSRYFWPESDWFTTRQLSISEGLASSFSILFGYFFLEIRLNLGRVRWAFVGLFSFGILTSLYGLCFPDIPSLALSAFAAVASSFMLISAGGYLAFRKRSRSALFYFIAWSSFCVSMLAFLFKYLGLIESTNFSTYSILLGGAIEALILSFALGDRIRTISSEKFLSQKRALETIKLAKDEQDNFIANTSHELRTPVGIIIGLADAVLRTHQLQEQTVSNIQMIKSSGSRLAGLLEDLLTAGRLKQMKIEIRENDLDLNAILKNIVEMSRPAIKSDAVSIEYIVNGKLPLVKGDQHRIEQVLTNLIDNAIKFSERGKITVTAEDKDEMVEVTVRDQGIGIPQSELKNIFVAFRQLDSGVEKKSKGLGLGLHIAKELVELQGGSIFAESTPNEGSSFHFTLKKSYGREAFNSMSGTTPMRLIDTSNAPTQGSIPLISSYFKHGERVRILAVDDEQGNRMILEQIFTADKFDLRLASNAHEAMNHINNEWKPSLAILDVMMPAVGGIRLTKMLRERFDDIDLPIVLLTAKGTVDTLVEGFEAGANEFVTKPVNAIELISRVNKHLQLTDFRKVAGLFVPPGLVKLFNESKITNLKLGTYRNLERAVLFSDIRNFSLFSEKLSDEELYKFTMHYFLRMAPIVRKYNGFIDKFMGDGIMAVFESAEDCANCALEMVGALSEYNAARLEHKKSTVNVGIGLHIGDVVAGIVGDPERLAATVLGDKVNTASRLESITKIYKVDIVASAEIAKALSIDANMKIRFIDRVCLYGKEDPTELWEIVALNGDQKNCESDHIRELNSLVASAQYPLAQQKLQSMQSSFPNDPILQYYANLIAKGLDGEKLPFDSRGNYMFLKKSA